MSTYKSFYDEKRDETYGQDYSLKKPEDHSNYGDLISFIERFNLADKRCLEIGSSGGFFQDMVEDYWGTDISENLSKYYHKQYRIAKDAQYPLENEMFDAIWTFKVFEHIPELQTALLEIKRLLKPGGVLLFVPAWHCRPWAANGYAVRPYSDFDWRGKMIKACIPLRENILWRSLFIFPKRIVRHLLFLFGFRFNNIKYKRLKANYDVFWVSDSDACNSIDPHDAILWFLSHGFECVSNPTHLSKLLVRHGGIIFRKK